MGNGVLYGVWESDVAEDAREDVSLGVSVGCEDSIDDILYFILNECVDCMI